MELLPEHLRASLPPLKSQEHLEPGDRIVYANYFIPGITYAWFVTEGEEQDGNFVFFGYIINQDGEEWNHFPLRELEEVNEKVEELKDVMDMTGLSVERVPNFKPTSFKGALAGYRQKAD